MGQHGDRSSTMLATIVIRDRGRKYFVVKKEVVGKFGNETLF